MQGTLVLVSIGNSRTRVARAVQGELEPSRVLENSDADAIASAVHETAGDSGARVLLASVNDPMADRLEAALDSLGIESTRFGRDVPVPIASSLPDGGKTGVDRLLAALGAFARSNQACIVIDAGTAVTVDFIDGQGTFQGGAIAPGLRMMLRAMHGQTASLPEVELRPDLLPGSLVLIADEGEVADKVSPFGKTTVESMTIGVVSAVRGLARELIDRYAAFYGGYPRIVATGGDAPLLFSGDSIIEHIVPDLVLIGMVEAVKAIERMDDSEETGDEP